MWTSRQLGPSSSSSQDAPAPRSVHFPHAHVCQFQLRPPLVMRHTSVAAGRFLCDITQSTVSMKTFFQQNAITIPRSEHLAQGITPADQCIVGKSDLCQTRAKTTLRASNKQLEKKKT